MIGRNMLVLLVLFVLVAAVAPAAADVPSWTVQYNASDLDGNGKIDYGEWVTPHLSNQTFEITLIAKAEHLDENKTIIEDVYDYASAQDNNWITIPSGDYLRVKFERELTNNNDITIYARALNGSSEIAVYKQEDNNEIARFSGIGDENWYKIYLTNLSDGESLDSFDLKSFGDVEYDYVVDPVATETLRPNGAGDETGLVALSGVNWDNVNDVTPDEDSSYVGGPLDVVQHPYNCPGGYARDLYSLSEASGSGNINNVTITVRAKYIYYQMPPTIYTKTVLGTGGSVYEGSAQQLTGSYADYETTYATNPKTGVAWTWSDISSLQAGVSLPRGCLYTDTLGSYGARSTQVYATINYNTDISSCPRTISSPGTYVLTQNISNTSTCITVNASNVIIDGQGHSLTGNGTGYGINLSGFNNVTLRNIRIGNFSIGLKITNSNDDTLDNMTFTGNDINAWFDPNNTVIQNSVFAGGQYGLILTNSNNNTLRNNIFANTTKVGALVNGTSTNNTFFNNTAYNNSVGIELNGSGVALNNLTANNVSSNTYSGIYLNSSSNNTLTNNTATSNWYGILFDSSSNNTLVNNTASSNTFDGVRLYGGAYNTIANNVFNLNDFGIFLASSSNNTLTNNAVNSNNMGIYLWQSSNNNTLTNNTANSNNRGIFLESSSNNTLANNTASSNSNYGISLASGSNNTLVNNTANSNGYYGIYLYSSSNNNIFTNNNATGNTQWDFYSESGGTGNIVINLTTQQNLVSFTSKDIALKGLTTAQGPEDTSGYRNISKYVNATNNSATSWLWLNISYNQSDVTGFNESFLRMYKYNATASTWQLADGAGVNNVSVDDNVVYANITEFGSTFAPLGLYLGNLTCTVSVSCGVNETDILHLSDGTNAHAELPNQTNYTSKVCCKDTSGFNTVLNSTGNAFLRLSNVTNAHAQLSGDYPFLAYIGGSQNGVACNARYVSGACSATNETCVLTMSNTTNAHVANCSAGAAYNLTVCCAFTTFPSCVLAAVENDTVIDGPDSLMWDAVNNSNTTANLTCDRTPVDCRWNETDIGYAAMSSASNCTISSANISCSFGDLAEDTYTRYVACADSYGNQQDASSNTDVGFGVDYTGPTSTILYPLSGAWLNILFSMTVGDSDPLDLSEIETCYWSFTDLGTAATGNATRTANSPFTVIVGPSGNCTTQGINQCNITAWCTDWAGNVGS